LTTLGCTPTSGKAGFDEVDRSGEFNDGLSSKICSVAKAKSRRSLIQYADGRGQEIPKNSMNPLKDALIFFLDNIYEFLDSAEEILFNKLPIGKSHSTSCFLFGLWPI